MKRTLFVIVVAALVCVLGAGSWAQPFDVSAPAAILIDAETGQVLFEKNADESYHPASLVKIMTLLIAMDAVAGGEISLTDPVRASRLAATTGGSRVFLTAGEVQTLEAMLRAVAIAGANDASVAVAEFVSGTEDAFVRRMNARAEQLAMTSSLFVNSHGLPPGTGADPSLTSARDISAAARELVVNHRQVLDWTSIRVQRFREEPLFNLYNTNDLVGWYDGLDGLRTGFTSDAGYLLVATAQRGDLRLISVVMAAASVEARQQDTRALLDYGFNRLQRTVVGADIVGEMHLPNGSPERFDVRVENPVRILVPRATSAPVSGRVVPHAGVEAPIQAGEEVGEYVVLLDGQDVLRVPVYAAVDVGRAGFFERMWRGVRGFVSGLLGR